MSLKVEDLKVYYASLRGDVKALDGVSFEVADGEIMGVAGESGCGKTTLGKALIRLDSRQRHVGGKVFLDDVEMKPGDESSMRKRRYQDVSLIPQYAMSAMNPTRKIGKMIADLVKAHGRRYTEIRPELERRLELVGLDVEVLERYPIELSGGMKQRVVLVISTLLNPSLLIGDEVTSALDVTSQKAVARALVEFRDAGFVTSMIVITHDISVLFQVADTIMVMYAGHLAEKAPAKTIINEPLHPYTKMLIGALPKVGDRYGEQELQGIEGRPPSLLNPPEGCRFRDRCPLAHDRCVERPPFVEVAPGHQVACWAVTA
ncbi:oligopeptide/dipeptide ABC transporter, ATPase subunit [Xylanimonas cellulosilytica DSM 15894]|uniref:Oligopeptide/dipeptide ABC transporter, ATPase subunit n=1 Tax=Xylanimonas cellulosilytica (strain DSM 15894 / JCM 12276 / CECT 5975 / KCTC 9989 / LMG 20990 / NBRC 107835 / XIL07) TaxID=446471 RepID=D1BUR3_XYLCX|nr:ABC transporter ATP-binding protein [Xylanimonas cellulosilytica]ACZ29304.1 oligopeptide/dipeptide ABC transporter, ATPase subunit [Xylanimonas cellulosilytica DSM 15894]